MTHQHVVNEMFSSAVEFDCPRVIAKTASESREDEAMAVEDDEYLRVMARLREEIPGLAAQLDDEFRHGRTVSGQGLQQEARYEEGASRLAASELPPLGKTDVAVIPYTGDERIDLIREALLTLAETMYSSRLAVLEMIGDLGIDPEIQFGDPALEIPSRFDLRGETERARQMQETVRELLGNEGRTYSENL